MVVWLAVQRSSSMLVYLGSGNARRLTLKLFWSRQGSEPRPPAFEQVTSTMEAVQASSALQPGRSVQVVVSCFTSRQHASVSQGRICSNNCTCCHTKVEVANQTCYLTQSQYNDPRPTSPDAKLISPGHWITNFEVSREKNLGARGNQTQVCRSRGVRLNHEDKEAGVCRYVDD